MYEDVLIATDGSEVARRAASQGLEVAREVEATVRALSVAGDSDEAERREAVDDLAASATDCGVPAETEVRTGNPAREILACADERGVDLVVMGTRGRTGIRRAVLGSVATAVIRESTRPVLTVNASATGIPRTFEDVLVATDGRPGVDDAVDHAVALAETYDATLHALSVVEDTRTQLEVVMEEYERASGEAVAAVATRAAERGVGTVRAVERGRPSEEILAYAEGVDLVVMGTESQTDLERLVVGSVSQRVASASPAPVLTVRGDVQEGK